MSDDEVGYRRESHHSPRDRDRRSRDHDRDRRDRDRSSYDDRRSRDRGGAGDDRDRSSSYSKRDRHYSDRQEDNDSATKDTESNDNSYSTDDSYYRRPRYSNNNSGNNSSGNNAGKGRWNDSIPNNIILVRGLPDEADENDIINEFARSGVAVKDVRLMRGKDTGLSRRYCFVEFHTVAESQYWMEVHQGVMKLQDKFTLNMYYSTSRRGNINSITVPDASIIDSSMDWICAKCSCKNFQRRSHCRRCNNSREESERVTSGDGLDQVGCNPCNTLILRGLDGLTTEENIINALSNVTTLPLKNVRVIRDFMTGASNGFAFVEMNSLKESKELLEYLETLENPLEVDGKALLIAYAKNTFSTALATMEMQQHNQTQYMQQQAAVASTGGVAGVGGVVGGYADYSQHGYYDVNAYYYQTTALPDPSSATQMDSTNAAAAVAQAAIMQSQQKKQSNTTMTTMTTMAVVAAAPVLNRPTQLVTSPTASTASTLQDYPKYPVPDVSTYQYEETSGYYYDPSTGLYYDASTQYYYNSQSQQWLYWDGEHQTYLPAPSTDAGVQQQQQLTDDGRRGEDDDEKKKRPQSPEKKVKIAKRIVKDMEKWAKRLNAQKDAMKDDMKKLMQTTTTQASGEPAAVPLYMESASADAGFSLLEKSVYSNKSQPEIGKLRGEIQQQSPAASSAAAAATGSIPSPLHTKVEIPGPSSSSTASSSFIDAPKSMFASEEEMTDWKKMACLLCRRAFPSKDVLIKHQQMSDLHKKNLEELYRSKGHVTDESLVQQYRDRAKERREKYGLPEPPQPKKRAREEVAEAVIPFEQPTQEGIKDDNIGNKLLQKMGWKDGQGLGRANQGIVDPIEARQRQAQAGLGARGSAYNVDTTSGSYKERARKTFMAYFHEIN